MASSTRYYKKTSRHFGWKLNLIVSFFVSLLLSSSMVFAATNSITIKQADLQLVDDFYLLNAEISIDFDAEIEEAINKGVPLHFLIEFQVVSPRKYWFDDEIITTTNRVVLSYHALTKQYLVNRETHQKSFETLDEAVDELLQLTDLKVFEKVLIEKDANYKAALLMRLDQTKLPKAIQVDAIASEKWNITSQKYEWPLKPPAK